MANKTQVATVGEQQAAVVINNQFIDGLTKQLEEKCKYGLSFPKDYNLSNALMGAYLVLKETKDRNNKPILESCSQISIANSLMNMATLGLSVQKKQGYFVSYAGQCQFQRSYFGNITIARRYGMKDIHQVNLKYALLLLHSLDQMITIEFGNPYYGRYNDDFYVLCKTKDIAREILEAVRMIIGSLGLELNPKSQIVPFRMGLCYLGFHHYVTDEGKYIRKLRGDRKRNTQKKVRRWVRAVNEEKMPVEKFNEKYGAWPTSLRYIGNGEWADVGVGREIKYTVSAWMPMPKAYKEK